MGVVRAKVTVDGNLAATIVGDSMHSGRSRDSVSRDGPTVTLEPVRLSDRAAVPLETTVAPGLRVTVVLALLEVFRPVAGAWGRQTGSFSPSCLELGTEAGGGALVHSDNGGGVVSVDSLSGLRRGDVVSLSEPRPGPAAIVIGGSVPILSGGSELGPFV